MDEFDSPLSGYKYLYRKMLHRYLLLVSIFAFMQRGIAKDASDSFRIHTDLPAINNDEKMLLDVFYSSDSTFKGGLYMRFYKYEAGDDSTLVLSDRNLKFGFKKGVNKTRIDFSKEDTGIYYAPKFYEILKRTNTIPPGSYKIYITVNRNDKIFETVYLREVDSLLSPNSPVRRDINKSLVPKSRSFLGMKLSKATGSVTSSGAEAAFQNARNKVDKATKKRGLKSVRHERNGKSYIDLYYQDWFAGRYEVKNKGSLPGQIKQQEDMAQPTNFNAATTNDLGHPSLLSQYKSLNNDKKDQDEIKGEISLTTNVSSGQEQYSDVDNNYFEVRGMMDMPIMGIPVQVEGLYTSQDAHRPIKSSYFRVHYDVDKMKEDLSRSMSSYNTKFSETQSKAMGMTQIYSSSISNLQGQRAKLQSEINAAALTNSSGIAPVNSDLTKNLTNNLENQARDTAGLKQALTNSADSSIKTSDTSGVNKAEQKEKKAKDAAAEKEKKIAEKRQKLQALDQKIEKYTLLLAQFKNTNYFDSTLGYDKTKGIANQSDMSYKQMAKLGTNMLPNGKVKSFLAGVTTMDAGMFPQYTSKYTMAGQMMKGLNFGYDLGFCETGITVGKTQYVGSDGSLDQYTCYSGKASFKAAKNQKITLTYYGYMADRKMYAGDGFFSNIDASAPGFFEPVHIISTSYDGAISRYVTIGGEAATSIKGSDKTDMPIVSRADKMAYHFNADGRIPNTAVSLEATYDKTGKGFENNTLPVSLAGTEQYKLAGRNDFFHAFLTVGIEYDRLVQNSFATSGGNSQWGFDIKTNSKRYPNIALSYKPFTTFQSYTDTLTIPQRPLLGSVWTGKATYQIKKKSRSMRFSIVYNKSMTTMDTTKYGNDLMQASFIYSDKSLTNSVSIGYSQITGSTIVPATSPNNTTFLSLSTNYALSKQFSLSGGQDFGMASFGFCRYSANGGVVFRPAKKPVTIRVCMRYNDYVLNEGDSWTQIYSGSIDLTYRFKTKMKDK